MEKERVLNLITKNPAGCDLVFSFFATAANSYRSDSRLRPFPPNYYNKDQEKDFAAVRAVCNDMPPLRELEHAQDTEFFDKCFKLLDWLYSSCDPNNYILCDINDFPLTLEKYLPKYIFYVKYNKKSELAWVAHKEGCTTDLAYHGSKLENFYSILRCGLQQIFSTDTYPLYGEGIYMSKTLSVSILYSPYSVSWYNSYLGQYKSVVTCCEYIDNDAKLWKGTARKIRPKKHDYIIAGNSDSIRIKYLLVYARKSPKNAENILPLRQPPEINYMPRVIYSVIFGVFFLYYVMYNSFRIF